MKNTFTLFIALSVASVLVCSFSAHAERLTPEQALSRYSRQRSAQRAPASARFELYHVESNHNAPSVYLFTQSGKPGFILLSADDSSLPVLGYSDSAILPSSDILLPPSFKYWLGTLARQVEYNSAHALKAQAQTIVGDPIAPLTTTRWNQDLPFNYYCPIAGDKHCYTGCVATALAQIMKYHNYPPKGIGSHSYGWKNPVSEVDTTLSVDFANTEFKWNLMQDKYDKEADKDMPWDDKMAVASLMYACGVAVDMGYGPWSSGAGTNMIGPAMVNYFGYDKGIRNYIRDYYGIDEWNEIVYNQLKDYGPVQYSGFGDTDGHSFVIDGYNEDGYFHVNWGWGGMSDGYFLLTALDPLEQGIGGADQAFDFSQDFVGNVSTGGKSTEMYEEVLLDNAFGLEQTTAKPGDTLHIWGGSFNYSIGPIPSIMFGAMLIPDAGTDTLHLTGPEYTDLKIGGGVRPYDVKLPDAVPAGTYSLVPAFRNSHGVWCEIPVKIGFNNHYRAVSDGTTISFTSGGEASLKASDIDSPTEVSLNEKFDVNATLINSTEDEFFGSVCVALFAVDAESSGQTSESMLRESTSIEDTPVVKSDAVPVDVLPGESQAFSYQALFAPADSTSIRSGNYELYICRQLSGKLTKISEPTEVYLTGAVVTGIGELTVGRRPEKVEYFTLLGTKIKESDLSRGVYIRVKQSPEGHQTQRILIPDNIR